MISNPADPVAVVVYDAPMTQLERVLSGLGWAPQALGRDIDDVVGPDEEFVIVVPFAHGELDVDFDGLVTSTGEVLAVMVAVPLVDFQEDRLVATELPEPIEDLDFEFDAEEYLAGDRPHDNEEADGARLVIGASIDSGRDGADGLGRAVDVIVAFVHHLVDSGVITLMDALEDDRVVGLMASVVDTKPVDPRRAVKQALEAGRLSKAVGDVPHASLLEIIAAEILLELGEAARAHLLAEHAWVALGEPLAEGELLTVVARARGRQGYRDAAVALMRQGIAAAPAPTAQARLQGNLGVIFAEGYQRFEAIEMLSTALRNPDLDPADRLVFEQQLAVVRDIAGDATAVAGPDPFTAGADLVDNVDARLNAIAGMLLAQDRRELDARIPRITELLAEVRLRTASLGAVQRAKVAHVEAALAYFAGDVDSARRSFETALSQASDAGDIVYESWLRSQAASFGLVQYREPTVGSSVFEQVGFHTNRAYMTLSTLAEVGVGNQAAAMRNASASAWRALRLVDAERHRYPSIDDRRTWMVFSARVYELALVCAHAVGDHALVFEMLERARGQGLPLLGVPDDVPSDWSTHAGDGSRRRENGNDDEPRDRPAFGLGAAREALGDLAVGPPIIASPSRPQELTDSDDSVQRLDVDALIDSIIGGPAWWWSCHLFRDRLYWVLRDPEGTLSSGFLLIDGGPEALHELLRWFQPIHTAEDAKAHPLFGDAGSRRERLLDRWSHLMLPESLRLAVVAAARRGEPIDVVWAPPRELAALPVLLLPVGGGWRIVDGARFVLAPPSALMATERPVRPSGLPGLAGRPVLAVLGADPDLGALEPMVGAEGLGLAPTSVFGGPQHVQSGLAATVATPDAVLSALTANSHALVVYYGHIDQLEGQPLSAAMSLTDGRLRAELSAADLLVSDRRGGPELMLLAGCSSLSATSSGTGEWWGLGTGLLWQGTQHVVGSTWDLLHDEVTMSWVVDLAERLRRSDRPHHALHEMQLDAYRCWSRESEGDSGQIGVRPYHWAGWVITSVRTGLDR